MARKLDVLSVGKTTVDQFLLLKQKTVKYRLDSKTGYLSFKHGEKIEVDEFQFCLGGNAANVAVGLSRLGLQAGLCSEVGDDEFSLRVRNELAAENIDRSYVTHAKEVSSSFSVIIDFKGERTILGRKMKRKNDFKFYDLWAKYIFLTSLEREWRRPYRQALSYFVKKGGKLAFNPGTLQLKEGMDVTLQIIGHSDLLFVNKEEAERIVFGHERRKNDNEKSYIRELLVKLQKMGAKTAVVTNGRKGSHAIDEYGNFYTEGLFSGGVVERTGAGDAYTSGFLAAMIYGKPVREAMRWGAVNSSSVVESVGATNGLLKKDILEKRAKQMSSKN